MRKSTLIVLGLACVFLAGADTNAQPGGKKKTPFDFGGGIGGFGSGPALSPPRVRWEYRTMADNAVIALGKGNFDAGLNKLGAEDWELITVDRQSPHSSMLFFRRPATGKPAPDVKPDLEPAPKGKEKVEDVLEFRIYALKNANAVDMAHLMEELLRINKLRLRVLAEPRTNQVIVNGTKEAQEQIEALISRLDMPADNEPAPKEFLKKKK